jgi:hypothetical protein
LDDDVILYVDVPDVVAAGLAGSDGTEAGVHEGAFEVEFEPGATRAILVRHQAVV